MTEADARTKWCPMARVALDDGEDGFFQAVFNRWLKANEKRPGLNGSLCIASDCMMWRWDWSPDDAAPYIDSPGGADTPSGDCGLKR